MRNVVSVQGNNERKSNLGALENATVFQIAEGWQQRPRILGLFLLFRGIFALHNILNDGLQNIVRGTAFIKLIVC